MHINVLGYVELNYQSNPIWLAHVFITCTQRSRSNSHDCAALQYFWEIKRGSWTRVCVGVFVQESVFTSYV